MSPDNCEPSGGNQTASSHAPASGAHADHTDTQSSHPRHNSKDSRQTVNLPWSFDLVAIIVMIATVGSTYYACESATLTRRSLEIAERAWIYPTDFVISGDPDGPTDIWISMNIVNSGRSPGKNVRTQAVFDLLPTGSDPGPVDWDADVTRNGSTMFPTRDGNPIRAQATTPSRKIMGDDYWKYADKSLSAFVRARVTYLDIFGKEHWTTACYFHTSGQNPASFTACRSGNDTDD